MNDLLEQGIAAYKAGKRDEARNFFIAFTKQSPDDERAWEWMSKVTNNEQERNYCLQQIARISPKSEALNTPNTQQNSFNQLPPQNIKTASLVTLTCPSCGGKLQITNDIERFACGYCGNEHVVRRSGGLVALAPVVDSLVKIEAGVDKTASELAIRRLREEVSTLDRKLNSTNEKYTKKVLYGVLSVMFGCGSAAGYIIANDSFGYFVIGIFFLIIGGSLIRSGSKKTAEEKKLEQILKEKKAELNRHENIVRQ